MSADALTTYRDMFLKSMDRRLMNGACLSKKKKAA
jgi:hypothetical protein